MSVSSIHQISSNLKLKISLPFAALLKKSRTDGDSQVGTHYGFVPYLDGGGDIFHSGSRPRSFSNVALHRLALADAGIDGLSKHGGLKAENDQLQYSDRGKYPSRIYEIPISRRFLFTVLCLCFGFLSAFRGWQNLYHKRGILGSALLLLSGLLGCLGFLVLLL